VAMRFHRKRERSLADHRATGVSVFGRRRFAVKKPNTSVSLSPHELFSRFARFVSALTAHPVAFALALIGVMIWALLGPALHYSEIWQLWINTSTTILTFLMVFLLQHAQSRDTRALQLKLDELLRAVKGARNELIDLENVPEEELEKYCREFKDLHLHYAQILEKKGRKIEVRAESVSVAGGSALNS